MFDIGFFEVLVIAIVGLLVIGPERLPETVRGIGLWLGRLKRSLRETRSELEKQIGADDIRRQLHNEEVMRSLESTRRQIEDAVQEGALPQDSPSNRKTKYREEEERPDHAHTQESVAERPIAQDATNKAPAADNESSEAQEAPADKMPSAEKFASGAKAPQEQSPESDDQHSANNADTHKSHLQN